MNIATRFLKLSNIILTGAMMIAITGAATAQNSIFELVSPEGSLSMNREAQGALSSSDLRRENNAYLEVWTFQGRAGQEVTIDMMTDQFDSYLYLVGPGFDDVISDDDGGAGCDARITETLLENGTFYVAATSISSGNTGTYRIRASDSPPMLENYGCGDPNPASIRVFSENAERLSIGELHTGRLSSSDPVVQNDRHGQGWVIRGRAGEAVNISLESDDFDTYLFVAGPGIDGFQSDDDGGEGSDSRIHLYFQENTDYTVIAAGFGESASGYYSIRVTEVDMSQRGGGELEIGSTFEGYLTPNSPSIYDGRPGQIWTLRGREGETVRITLRSEDFDTHLYVNGPNMDRVDDDDSAGDLDSRLTITFPSSGEYEVVAAAHGSDGSGEYTLQVGDVNVVEGGGELEIGGTVSGYLSEDAPEVNDTNQPGHTWTLRGRRGETVRVTLRSEDFDTYLYIDGPGLRERMGDDDSAGDLDSRLTITFPESGTYEIIAAALGSGSTGEYTLQVMEDVDPESAPAQGTLRTNRPVTEWLSSDDPIIFGDRPGHIWEFDGDEGNTVTFEVSADFDTYMYIMGPGMGDPRSDDDSGEGNGSRITFTFPESGTYRIVVSGYSNSAEGEYTLRAEGRR